MIRMSALWRLAFTSLVILLLVGCAPAAVEQGLSPEEVAAQVSTSVAMTVEAQGQIATSVALTVAAKESEQAALQPTATLPPTQTPITILTATPFPTATLFVSGGGGGGGGGGGNTTYEYSCDPDIGKRPFDNTEFSRGDSFDVKFSILNNGTATWEAGKDLVLLGNPGNTLINPPGMIQLPKMKPGDTFAVGPFDAVAPMESGRYVIDFKLEGGFCYPYIAFTVK